MTKFDHRFSMILPSVHPRLFPKNRGEKSTSPGDEYVNFRPGTWKKRKAPAPRSSSRTPSRRANLGIDQGPTRWWGCWCLPPFSSVAGGAAGAAIMASVPMMGPADLNGLAYPASRVPWRLKKCACGERSMSKGESMTWITYNRCWISPLGCKPWAVVPKAARASPSLPTLRAASGSPARRSPSHCHQRTRESLAIAGHIRARDVSFGRLPYDSTCF